MRLANVIRALGPIDLRSVQRDSLLRWMVLLIPLMALLIRWLVPSLTGQLADRLDFDLVPYYPVIISYFFVMLVPLMFGMVIGFLLLDERDDQTLAALQVTPLSMANYLAYRIATPMLLSIALLLAVIPLTGLNRIGFLPLLLVSLGAAPLAPVFALFLATFAANKVQGFALMKGLGAVLIAPVVAFFVASGWQLAFGLMPTYWPVKVYWLLDAGRTDIWGFYIAGLLYQFVLLILLLRRFDRVLHR